MVQPPLPQEPCSLNQSPCDCAMDCCSASVTAYGCHNRSCICRGEAYTDTQKTARHCWLAYVIRSIRSGLLVGREHVGLSNALNSIFSAPQLQPPHCTTTAAFVACGLMQRR
jgi:hypothetical protein